MNLNTRIDNLRKEKTCENITKIMEYVMSHKEMYNKIIYLDEYVPNHIEQKQLDDILVLLDQYGFYYSILCIIEEDKPLFILNLLTGQDTEPIAINLNDKPGNILLTVEDTDVSDNFIDNDLSNIFLLLYKLRHTEKIIQITDEVIENVETLTKEDILNDPLLKEKFIIIPLAININIADINLSTKFSCWTLQFKLN